VTRRRGSGLGHVLRVAELSDGDDDKDGSGWAETDDNLCLLSSPLLLLLLMMIMMMNAAQSSVTDAEHKRMLSAHTALWVMQAQLVQYKELHKLGQICRYLLIYLFGRKGHWVQGMTVPAKSSGRVFSGLLRKTQALKQSPPPKLNCFLLSDKQFYIRFCAFVFIARQLGLPPVPIFAGRPDIWFKCPASRRDPVAT